MSNSDQPLGLGCSEGLGLAPERATLDALAAQALAQMETARDFPRNTCGASRHVAMLAEAILRGEPCPQLSDEPQHCAESMAWTVAALWYARTELERVREQLASAQQLNRELVPRARLPGPNVGAKRGGTVPRDDSA